LEKLPFKVGIRFLEINMPAVSRNLPGKPCVLVAVFFLILLISRPVNASFDGFLTKCDNGFYHHYCYEELLDSYALSIMNRSDGLYDDFKANKPVALHTGDNSYVDYADILDQYALVLKSGESFNLKDYIAGGEAGLINTPDQILIVSLSAGLVVREVMSTGETNTVIVASPKVSKTDALKWAKDKNAHQRFIEIASLYWEYGEKTGIRPEVLYAQSALETGFGHYGGIVPPEYNNWAGIKKADTSGNEPEDHEQFATPEDGVRAHFNHMSAYVGLPPIGEPHGRYYLVKRFSWAGTIEVLEELSGKWAPSPAYHQRIVAMLQEMKFNNNLVE